MSSFFADAVGTVGSNVTLGNSLSTEKIKTGKIKLFKGKTLFTIQY